MIHDWHHPGIGGVDHAGPDGVRSRCVLGAATLARGSEELGQRVPDTTALRDFTGWSSEGSLYRALDDVIAYQRIEPAIETPAATPDVAGRSEAAADAAG